MLLHRTVINSAKQHPSRHRSITEGFSLYFSVWIIGRGNNDVRDRGDNTRSIALAKALARRQMRCALSREPVTARLQIDRASGMRRGDGSGNRNRTEGGSQEERESREKMGNVLRASPCSGLGSRAAATPRALHYRGEDDRAISEAIRTKRAFSFYLYLGAYAPRHGIPKEVGGVKTNWIHGWSRARGSSGQLTES